MTASRTNRRLTSPGEEGFSLVELLVAIFLFGLVMTPLTGVFISAARSIGDQRLRTAATRVATDHLERLRSLPFEQLGAQAGDSVATTPEGRTFKLRTEIVPIDATTGADLPAGEPAVDGAVRRITVTVAWSSGGDGRNVSYTTAIRPDDPGTPAAAQAIGSVTMFPSPAVADASGRPREDIQVTVPLEGFAASTLVHLSWSNADGTAGAQTLTSTGGQSWRGTIAKIQMRAAIGTDGRGELNFNVAAGSLATVYTLSLQAAVTSPPVITGATIDRSPITVASPGRGRTCADRNQCQNTTDVTFTATVEGLDPTDSVILQYQLPDGTSREVPLTAVSGQWRLTIRQKTTMFLTGPARPFRLSAIRSADDAAAATTILRDVVSV